MAEFEEKLNAILGNQEAMGQIMALAQSLSGGGGKEEEREENDPADQEETGAAVLPPVSQSGSDLSAMLGQIDPNMIALGMDIIRQVQSTEDRNAALLNALRPFLREERRARLDRALEIARMTKMIRAVLGALGGKEGVGRV